jgi:hypothetical protein
LNVSKTGSGSVATSWPPSSIRHFADPLHLFSIKSGFSIHSNSGFSINSGFFINPGLLLLSTHSMTALKLGQTRFPKTFQISNQKEPEKL